MVAKLIVYELQEGQKPWRSEYRYCRYDRNSGLHVFANGEDEIELFRKTKNGSHGWQLQRGAYRYEFIRDF